MLPRFISLLGLVVLLACAWLLSSNRRTFPWRAVLWGLALQFVFGFIILRTGPGKSIFHGAQNVVNHLNDFALEGGRMVFGPLADGATLSRVFGPTNGYVFAVVVSVTIVFISALSSLLYHWGLLQRVVRAMAWVMRAAMGTSGSESLAAASNIFLGQTEAALLIKPYLARMTRSEIMALMTAGMATIASGVMVVYAQMGVDAGHLLTASVLSAPAALLVAKIMVPELESSETSAHATAFVERSTINSIDALCRGASEGVMLALNVLGMLIAFVAVVACANALFGWVQQICGVPQPVKLEELFGWLNAPFAWLMGVPGKDCALIGQFLGERIVLNEFVGYLGLSAHKTELDVRSFTLATYALCGFANFASIAIQIGGIGSLAPNRRHDLAALGLRSMVGGLLACYLTATVAGIIL